MQDLDKFKNEMNLSGKNVYVGHRYVPKIMGEWDNSQIYEPLSIVQYQGNSFTSRQYVPVGVEITNEEFWASTGNYNAQVEQYRQDVMNLGNDVNNINDEVLNARNGETNLKARLDKDHQQVESIQKNIDEVVFNVLNHGLVNDGVTDNSQALEDLILNTTNAKLYFPRGKYLFSKPVNGHKNLWYDFEGDVTNTNLQSKQRGVIETIHLVGESKENTIFLSNGQPIFKPVASETPYNNFNYTLENIRLVGKDRQSTPFEIVNGKINIIYARFINCDFNNWEYGFKYDFRGVPDTSNFNTMCYFDRCNFGGNDYGLMTTGDNTTLNETFIRSNELGGIIIGGAQVSMYGGKVEYNGNSAPESESFQIKILTETTSLNFENVYIEPRDSWDFTNNHKESIIVFEKNSAGNEYISNINFRGCRFNGLEVGALARMEDYVFIRGLRFTDCHLFSFRLQHNEFIHVVDTSYLRNVSITGGEIFNIKDSDGNTISDEDYVMTTHKVNTPKFDVRKISLQSSEIAHNGNGMEIVTGVVNNGGAKNFGTSSYSVSKESVGKFKITLYKENKGIGTQPTNIFPVNITPRYTAGGIRNYAVESVNANSFIVHMLNKDGEYVDNGFTFEAILFV